MRALRTGLQPCLSQPTPHATEDEKSFLAGDRTKVVEKAEKLPRKKSLRRTTRRVKKRKSGSSEVLLGTLTIDL